MADLAYLRIGYVPEHFSTPLHFAQKHFNLNAQLLAFPSGTGHMISSLRSGELDVAIGLTEGWVAGLGSENLEGDGGYRLVGTYVESPLCWAISTGAERKINSVANLRGSTCGVSRIGSGSYVMAFALALQHNWHSHQASNLSPFKFIPFQTFEALRKAVNSHTADFFMWEHFTTKKYYNNGELKKIGEIYTPWSSWIIAASTSLSQTDTRLEEFFVKLDRGIKYFETHQEEAVNFISTYLDYSANDAWDWLNTVKFPNGTKGVDLNVIKKASDVLREAGVLGKNGMDVSEIMKL